MMYSFREPRSGVPLRDLMDQLFSEAVLPSRRQRGSSSESVQTPPVNMYETDADLMVVVPLPGMSPNDIDVEVMGNQLTIRTNARRDVPHPEAGPEGGSTSDGGGASGGQERRYYMHEFQIGPHHRTIELPREVNIDQVHSSYEHGLLSLRFPRRQAERPRRINLQSSESSSNSGSLTGSTQSKSGSTSSTSSANGGSRT